MKNPVLGKMEKVDLHTIWENEASDFTPWLAEENNLSLLGESIGVELECVSIEEYIGSFKADIICKDTLNDRYVIIENQLETTDHNHLGQILTYAAGLDDVSAVIWIAKSFRDEHRAALDWLNKITNERINLPLRYFVWVIGNTTGS